MVSRQHGPECDFRLDPVFLVSLHDEPGRLGGDMGIGSERPIVTFGDVVPRSPVALHGAGPDRRMAANVDFETFDADRQHEIGLLARSLTGVYSEISRSVAGACLECIQIEESEVK